MITESDYLQLLEYSYSENRSVLEDDDCSKLEFVGENIFGFTTYENVVLSLLTLKALEVCIAISNRRNAEYQSTEDGELWYLIMVNMPFFKDKLGWGTSIRGAWWDFWPNSTFVLKSCGLWKEGKQVLELSFSVPEWEQFIVALTKFSVGLDKANETCPKHCSEHGACPFSFTDISEKVQGYGCLPTPYEIIQMRQKHGKTWACHSNPSKPCLGALKYLKKEGLEFTVIDPKLVTERDDWTKLK